MDKTALIFGAGKTGRGFAAHLAYLGGYRILLIDKDLSLVSDLRRAGQYEIQVLGEDRMSCTIKPSGVFHIDDPSWVDHFVVTGLVFTAVFGNNLESLAGSLAPAFARRSRENPGRVLTVITCENFTNAAAMLRKRVQDKLRGGSDVEGKTDRWSLEKAGFSESMILRTCLDAGAGQSPLTIRAQNYFELPCDGDAVKEELSVYGLKPLPNFANQLRRKIYTYNCINAVITYLGAQKGYTQLYEAGNDAAVLAIARKAARETSLAQVAEFGFDAAEQEEWVEAAFAKFADINIPDPIERNGADPARKLGREDRLIGPALLALKHGIYPEGLLKGIMACFDYRDPGKEPALSDRIREKGVGWVLKEICGLSAEEPLFLLISEQVLKTI
jgi:mannitol-1-phosphate 5-dehydrogenase